MQEIIFITGGQRSGKSRFAQNLAEKRSAHPVYLATSRHWDDDFTRRIERHQAERGDIWRTIEEEKRLDLLEPQDFSQASQHTDETRPTVVLDCVTLWLTNIFYDNGYNVEKSLKEAQAIWDAFVAKPLTLIAVSNEVGMGLHAPEAGARHFADLQGWMNQYIAAQADTAYVLLSGIPLKLK